MTKQALYLACLAYVQQRIQTATTAMQAAQESANSESKSSAGDKYETGRAMAQLERDRHAQLLAEALKMQQELTHLDLTAAAWVRPGSLVCTAQGVFFVSISAGRLVVDGHTYLAISPASPLAQALRGKRPGEEVVFNQIRYVVEAVE